MKKMTDFEKFELWRDAFLVSLKAMLERGMSLKGPNELVYYPAKEAGLLADHALKIAEEKHSKIFTSPNKDISLSHEL
jgi:hypothetical protein